MDEAKELLQLDWRVVLIGVVAIAAFFKVAVDFLKWLIKQFGIEFKTDRIKKEEHDLLMKQMGRIDELETEQKRIASEAEKYDDALRKDVEKLQDAISIITRKIDAMAEKADATERADLKDRIAQRYRKYTIEKQWTGMEKESFIGLIRDYEAHGGKNSFVHDICEPESYTWIVVDGE